MHLFATAVAFCASHDCCEGRLGNWDGMGKQGHVLEEDLAPGSGNVGESAKRG